MTGVRQYHSRIAVGTLHVSLPAEFVQQIPPLGVNEPVLIIIPTGRLCPLQVGLPIRRPDIGNPFVCHHGLVDKLLDRLVYPRRELLDGLDGNRIFAIFCIVASSSGRSRLRGHVGHNLRFG